MRAALNLDRVAERVHERQPVPALVLAVAGGKPAAEIFDLDDRFAGGAGGGQEDLRVGIVAVRPSL